MPKINRIWFFLGALWLAPGIQAQLAQSSQNSSSVLRTTTRLVQIDVVVTDSSGRPVKGLTQQDFSVTEDGKPQKISVFSFQESHSQGATKAGGLPPYVTTNRPEFHGSNAPPVVLLLDGVNTPVANQIIVRRQMLKFLAEHYDPSVPMAVFALGNELTVLQDFTSDPRLLYQAMENYHSRAAAAGRQSGDDVQLQAPTFDPLTISPRASQQPTSIAMGGAGGRSLMNIASALARFEKEVTANSLEMRIAHTMDALSEIARYLSGYGGRKALVWFSASFPLNLSMVDPEDLDVYRSYADRIRETTNLLSDAQVAVYTVNASGLVGTSIADPAETGRDGNGRMQLTVEDHMRANSKEIFTRINTEDSLIKVAQETGGRAFLNTNDFDRALRESLEDSSAFYVLGYYPSRKRWDGRFHEFNVKVARGSVTARHRRGYYAVDPENWRKGQSEDLKTALQNNSLRSTSVLFYARAVPPAPGADTRVEFLVDPHTITFETVSENEHFCDLEFQVQAYTPDGKLVRAEVQTAEAPLKPGTFERIQKNGLPMPVPMRLEAGDYVLRLGVRDNRTGQFGTAELPVSIPGAAK